LIQTFYQIRLALQNRSSISKSKSWSSSNSLGTSKSKLLRLDSVQAFALDAHFLLEQIGRNQQQHFINFNGTAGIWRKSCILDAGNWEGDTLTEDLDLSYRAQLKQWKFVYLDQVVTPAELPITLDAIRSQQFRWNKGGAENFQKMIGKVLHTKKHSLSVN